MKKIIPLILFIVYPWFVWSQYPLQIMPGQNKTLISINDTLWVIRNKQFDNALKAGEHLKICNEIKDSLKSEIFLQNEKIDLLEKNCKDYQEGYDKYKVMWENTDKTNEDLEIKLEKQKRKTKTIGIISAIGSAFITGLLFILL